VFAAGGFDAVVGNPPWEEVTVEELAFYARYRPGLRGMADAPRRAALAALKAQRPELEERLEGEQAAVAAQRRFFAADTGYEGGPGDPDLYKFFCQRYRALLAPGGALAVVLPRSTFLVKGSARFRGWLFSATTGSILMPAPCAPSWCPGTAPRAPRPARGGPTRGRGSSSDGPRWRPRPRPPDA